MTGGKKVGFDNSVFLSEKQHSDRNLSLAYYMRENRAYPYAVSASKLMEILDFYFQFCSIKINCEMGAAMASCLANSGKSPLSGEMVFKEDVVRDCLALMYSCGMYDFSGQFSFEIGLPAKSGVSGCIFLVIPNVMGVCIYSPRLDEMGNSVRGIEVCRKMKHFFKAHIFQNSLEKRIDFNKINDKYLQNVFIQSAFNNDLDTMKQLLPKIEINKPDYNGKTALHIAINEKHYNIIEFLEDNGADWVIPDLGGKTPKDILEEINGRKRKKE